MHTYEKPTKCASIYLTTALEAKISVINTPQSLDVFQLLELMTGSPTLTRGAGDEAIGDASTESSSSTSLNTTASFISSRADPSSFFIESEPLRVQAYL